MSVTPATVLASIEAIPETPENYRTLRAALRDMKTLIDKEALETSQNTPAVVVHVHHDTEAHARSFNEGYERAVTQGLADDPTLADDWLQEKLREARAKALEGVDAKAQELAKRLLNEDIVVSLDILEALASGKLSFAGRGER